MSEKNERPPLSQAEKRRRKLGVARRARIIDNALPALPSEAKFKRMTPEERAEVAKPYAVFLRAEEADADALATDSARRLGVPPRVVRGRIRTLRNDLYDLGKV